MRSRPVSVPNLAPGRKTQRCKYSSHDGSHGSNGGPRRSNRPHRKSHASHNRSEYLPIRDASGRGDATTRHDGGSWRGHRRRFGSKRVRAMPAPPRGAAQTPAQEIHGSNSSQTEHSVSHGSMISLTSPADLGSKGRRHSIYRPSTPDALGIWARARPDWPPPASEKPLADADLADAPVWFHPGSRSGCLHESAGRAAALILRRPGRRRAC